MPDRAKMVKHFGATGGEANILPSRLFSSRRSARTEIHGLKRFVLKRSQRKKRDPTMHVGAGAVELVKHGAARYDFSDPYHIAIELSWKGFALAFIGLELGINILFALLYLASPGCIS